ncbi:autotransporter assembly complex family protein [Rubrivivax sp. JA1055]|uniref:autotransporter assembly complex protein TamA n=1 Tax=Rubrivivax sp. JA1055 TaxID=2894194 RepID=UPI001E63D16F|nr:BamA/TamA family outer membrane protein [Rubrivivax sp. JA1055]MCC9597277.1 BamA/TamA family outer membrane protein [Rubrivivax sp. JA1055]
MPDNVLPARGRRLRSPAPCRPRGAGRAALPAAWLVCLALGGCAGLAHEPADRPDAQATTEPAESAPVLVLRVAAPETVRALLEQQLDLARLPALAQGRRPSVREVERLIAAAPEQVQSLVETEGFFTPTITIERYPGDPPVVLVRVEPGPRARVRGLKIEINGPLAEARALGEAEAVDGDAALREDWPLDPGEPFRNEEWAAAKRSALARLRALGYARAEWVSTLARVDATAHRVDLELVADSGPLFRTGELRIRGLQRQDEATVRNLAGFRAGTPATEKLLLDFQERLQRSGLFTTASVQLDARAEDPGRATITVRVAEREIQEATFGLGVSSEVGPRGTVEHVHRRAFGQALTARNTFELGRVRRSWTGELSTHPLPGLYRNLVGGAAERIESSTDIVSSVRARLGRAQETPRIDRLLYVEAERSVRRLDDGTRTDADALSLHYQGVWRRVDNMLLPTEGWVFSGQVGGGRARSDPGGTGPFVRAWGRLAVYQPLGRWYGTLRLEAGEVFARDDVLPPESLLFRAGGDGSVRGYEYRSLAPTDDGIVSGGKVMATASAEIARPILARLPQLWGAAFVDAGRAADRWQGYRPAVGYGVGLRLRSPIGPLSVDVARGHETGNVRLHLSVGVTF